MSSENQKGGDGMSRIVLDMQSGIFVRAIQRILLRELAEWITAAKLDGKMDAFLFGTATDRYPAAVMDSP